MAVQTNRVGMQQVAGWVITVFFGYCYSIVNELLTKNMQIGKKYVCGNFLIILGVSIQFKEK